MSYKEIKQKLVEFILEFEKRYHQGKTKEMMLAICALAFELLDASGLPHRDQELVLSSVGNTNKDTMKASLKEVHGDQAIPELSDCLKENKLYDPFLWKGFNCLKARATSRRQFTFYH